MSSTQPHRHPYLRWHHAMDPRYQVNSAAISADGSMCVAATWQGAYNGPPPPPTDYYRINCWDRSGKLLWSDKYQAFEGAFACAISGDGSVAAAGGWLTSTQGFVTVFNAKTGAKLITYTFTHRVNSVALSYDGTVLAIGENDVFLAQQANGSFPTAPKAAGLSGSTINSVAMPTNGSVVVAGDYSGNVYLFANNNGNISKVGAWASGSTMGVVHSVAISSDGSWFTAAGDSKSVYLFNLASIKLNKPATSLALEKSEGMRWVTISADGSFIATVANYESTKGLVYAIKNDNGTLSTIWNQPAMTTKNPNCVSTDAAAQYVVVATGYTMDNETGGAFCLFDAANGNQLWIHELPKMAWPCFISADASGIIGGSDDGIAYYFTPKAA